MYLGKHLTLIKDTNWDEYFFSFFRLLGRACSSSQNFKEVPDIPFTTQDLVFKGRTVAKQDWMAYVENNGIEITLKNMAEKLILTDRMKESTILKSRHCSSEKLFRRIYVTDEQVEYCCGSIFKGNFKNSKREGLCVLRLSTKDYIKAEYVKGLRNGMGFAQYNEYEPFKMISYEGEYENDMRSGYGELMLDNGGVFNGDWKLDLQNYGTFQGMGHKYMGYWKGKLMDVKGIYKTPDGKVYRGEIQNGRFVGEGEFIDTTQIIKGKFENNGDLNEKGRDC